MQSEISGLIQTELFKARRTRAAFILPLLVVALSVVSFFGFKMAAGSRLIGLVSGFFLSGAAGGWMVRVISLISVIIAGFIISNEFSMGTVKTCWTVPVERGRWLIAKVLWACCVVTVLFMIAVIIVVILSAVTVGFGDLMEKNYLVHSSASLWGRLFLTYGLELWGLWSVVVVSSLAAVMFNRPGITVSVVTGAGIAFLFLDMFPPVRPLLVTTWISMPMEQMGAMAKGLPLPLEWGELVWKTILAGGVWMGLSLLGAVKIINGKEITF